MKKSLPKIVEEKVKKFSHQNTYKVESHVKNITHSLESLIFSREKVLHSLITKKRIALLFALCFIFSLIDARFASKGVAEQAVFYPTSCLGGWANPHNAEGSPETAEGVNDFSETNSASLSPDVTADLYCGSFKGDVPKSTIPTKMTLTILWKTSLEASSTPITTTSFASSTLQILDATSTITTFTNTSTRTSDVTATSDTDTIHETESVAPVDAESATSPTGSSDPSPQTVKMPVADPSAIDTVPDISPSDPQSYLGIPNKNFFSFFASPVYALDGKSITDSLTDSVTEKATTSSTSTETASNDMYSSALVEVFYTIDGSTWNSLGKVDKAGMAFNTFELPITSTSTWDDISNIQFKIESVTSVDAKPVILLDGMILGVEYKTKTESDEKKGDLKGYHLTVGTVTGDMTAGVSVDPIQGESFTIGSSLGGTFILYKNDSEDSSMTGGMGNTEPTSINSNTFELGTYTVLITGRADGCASMSLSLCMKDKEIIGHTTLKVTPTEDTPLEYVHTQ